MSEETQEMLSLVDLCNKINAEATELEKMSANLDSTADDIQKAELRKFANLQAAKLENLCSQFAKALISEKETNKVVDQLMVSLRQEVMNMIQTQQTFDAKTAGLADSTSYMREVLQQWDNQKGLQIIPAWEYGKLAKGSKKIITSAQVNLPSEVDLEKVRNQTIDKIKAMINQLEKKD